MIDLKEIVGVDILRNHPLIYNMSTQIEISKDSCLAT